MMWRMRRLLIPLIFTVAGCDPSLITDSSTGTPSTGGLTDTTNTEVKTDVGPVEDVPDVVVANPLAIVASRKSCVSPCAVVLSAENIPGDLNISGYAWDYDDNASETLYHTRGASAHKVKLGVEGNLRGKNVDVGTYLGSHVYRCDTDLCTFTPTVSVAHNGAVFLGKATVVVQGQEAAYPGHATVCVSSTGNFDGCPAEAMHAVTLPALGAWSSNTRYLLRRGDQFNATCMAYNKSSILVDAFGEGERPVVMGTLGIGRDASCSDAIPNIDTITTSFWTDNITITNIRVPEITLGMTWRDVGIVDVDMDYGASAAGGRINVKSTDACTKNTSLSCVQVPLPQGLYIAGTKIIGSKISPPGLNVEFLSSTCVSFMSVTDSEMQRAVEHNIRLECGSRVFIAHNDVNGDHVGGRGPKNAITIRPEGHSTDDMRGQQRRVSTDRATQYENKYVVILDNYLGKPGVVDANAARITIAPTKDADAESTYMGLVSGNFTDLTSGLPTQDVHLAGRNLVCYNDNTFITEKGCQDKGIGSIPPALYSPAITDMLPPLSPLAPSLLK